jgi:hypothetical protein
VRLQASCQCLDVEFKLGIDLDRLNQLADELEVEGAAEAPRR